MVDQHLSEKSFYWVSQLRPNHSVSSMMENSSLFNQNTAFLLLGVFAGVLIIIFYRCAFSRIKKQRQKKRLLNKLQHIENRYINHKDARKLIYDYNIFLKKIAACLWPDISTAKLHGKNWLIFLDRTSDSRHFTKGAGCVLGEHYKPVFNYSKKALSALIHQWVERSCE